ncbi:hydrogenase nickel insertion protein HypA [Candidatus Bathyarchaeota archaeon]|nr:MAG: hydrogenase nickel insertion protein HypA [Candidatus Bathyarchaeota archaeon]
MHEWALAEAVIKTVSQIAEKEGLDNVSEVNIRLGELQQVDVEIFKFALSQLKAPKLEKAQFNIRRDEAKLRCRVCSYEWTFSSVELDEEAREAVHFVPEIAHAFMKCPRCGSPDFEVVSGRGVWIESVKGVKRHG